MTSFHPYQLASREAHPENTLIQIGQHIIGQDFTTIAGLCSVETEDITLRIAQQLALMGIQFFRAGAYKPRTNPYSFQGLGKKGLEILQKVKETTGMHIVTEVLDTETLPMVCEVADIIQIGARNMNNTSLLKSLGAIKQPVLLKRGLSATLDEFLMAAEYILFAGNPQVILCERGIRTFNNHCRGTLDIAAIPALKARTHLPILVDPSHAAGTNYLVTPLSLAAVAAGTDGLLIEVHDNPELAYSDGSQALYPEQLDWLLKQAKEINHLIQAPLPYQTHRLKKMTMDLV